ncbi:hypothetical protein niasHT_022391 [Heterodera trifolii]|uniref:MAM domain-containing protein n=1 Tax=Heterodera trifolii TaxID=157864 RepID=A0ABD2KQ00_9BILA
MNAPGVPSPRWLVLLVFALLHCTFDCLCCIGFSAFSSLSASPYYHFCCGPNFGTSHLVAKGVPNVPFSPSKDIGEKRAQKCQSAALSEYRTNELHRLVTLYQFYEDQSATNLSCSFEQPENCAWHNAKSAQFLHESEAFVRGRFDSAEFNWDKFECTGERAFPLDGFFLLAGGSDAATVETTAAIEAKVPCQTEKATLKFDYWSINETPTLKVCVVPEKAFDSPQCEESKMDVNPLTFEIPQNGGPFRIRIEVDNIVGREDMVLIDNIKYDGNGGKNCLNEPEVVTKNAVDGLLINKKQQLAISDDERGEFDTTERDEKEEEDEEEEEEGQKGGKEDETANTSKGDKHLELFGLINEKEGNYHEGKPQRKMPLSQRGKEFGQHSGDIRFRSVLRRTKDETFGVIFGPQFASLCEALKCNFDNGKACKYKLRANGGMSAWKIAKGPVGNVHTGIHKDSRGQNAKMGFAFVGSDSKESENEFFVFVSPELRVDRPVTLLFDLFQRSVGPQLRVCLNTLRNCSYENPAKLDKVKHWLIGQKVLLPRGTERVFFLGSKVRRNHFIAIDNIRLQPMNLSREICESEENENK